MLTGADRRYRKELQVENKELRLKLSDTENKYSEKISNLERVLKKKTKLLAKRFKG